MEYVDLNFNCFNNYKGNLEELKDDIVKYIQKIDFKQTVKN